MMTLCFCPCNSIANLLYDHSSYHVDGEAASNIFIIVQILGCGNIKLSRILFNFFTLSFSLYHEILASSDWWQVISFCLLLFTYIFCRYYSWCYHIGNADYSRKLSTKSKLLIRWEVRKKTVCIKKIVSSVHH